MKTALIALTLLVASVAFAKDHSGDYKIGTYLALDVLSDGTIGDNSNCGALTRGATVCSGGIRANGVAVYRIQVADGVWKVATQRQIDDSMMRRNLGIIPMHFKAEKQNPLDLLKNNDKLMFRIEDHKMVGGVDHDIFVPFADNPNKEAKFVGWFIPTASPIPPKSHPSDNVSAMCNSGKLSPELKSQYCHDSAETKESTSNAH